MSLELLGNTYPQEWTEAFLPEVCNPKQWKTISTSELTETGYVVYGANGKIGFYSTYTHEKPTLMITCRGATCGNLHISVPFAYINGNAMALDELPENLVTQKYLYYALKARGLDDAISGSAQPQITRQGLSVVNLRIAPLAEQQQIAQKLDELLAQVDTLKTRLDAIPKILKRFRQSVLAAAVSGRLTEEWRKNNTLTAVEKDEILISRKNSWEVEELRKMKALQKSPINDKWKSRYKSASDVITENCFSIPSSWCWSNIGELTYSVKDGPHFSPKYESTGIPFISGGNIRSTGIDFSNTKFISLELHEELSKRCKPEIGDVLYTKGGTTGIAYLNKESREFNVWVHVAVLKLTKKVDGVFFQNALNSKHCYDQSQSYTHGVGNQDLGLTRLVNITVPVPPLEEQTEIVRRVEQLFAYADQIEQRVKDALARVNHLTQSILAKAFRGELTADWRAQNPDLISGENSAAALLERIKAEREVNAKPKKKKA